MILMMIMINDPEKSCLSVALSLLGRRKMASYTLRKKLENKGYTPDEIQAAINRLLEWGYLDDRSFAVTLIRNKNTKQSKRKVFYDLIKAGIDKYLAQTLLEQYYPDELEIENCLATATKLLASERGKVPKKAAKQAAETEADIYQKIHARLVLKGYSVNSVYTALEQVFERENY